jgi:hypothetical protein
MVDRGLIEKVGPFGIINFINLVVKHVREYQTGFIMDYLKYFVLFSIVTTASIFCDLP